MKNIKKMKYKNVLWKMICVIGVLFLCTGICMKLINDFQIARSSISVIGGADGPTSIYLAGQVGVNWEGWIAGIGILLVMIFVVRFVKKKNK